MPLSRSSLIKFLMYAGGLACAVIVFLCPEAQSAPSATSQTQAKLKQLDVKINRLQHTLSSAQDKRGLLNKELSGTERQIDAEIHKLNSIQFNITAKKTKITHLQQEINHLNSELTTQQQLFAHHIRARYQMGEYQPLKWVLNQDEPYQINQILTYYQYMITSRQQLIAQIDNSRKKINTHKENLHTELLANQSLQQQLSQHQQQLQHNKKYHTALIQSLNNQIQTNQHALKEFQHNKENLSRLLHSLAQQSAVQNSKPFAQMRRKLPLPVQTKQKSLRKMNQGVTFFADAGSVVTAVYPGKVVFSDWLKGYGLLLIIDHGQGFMTLYAHNQSLFKHKGQNVRQNEQIASVGHSGGIKQNGLYFEIRLRGKAVSPLDWLS